MGHVTITIKRPFAALRRAWKSHKAGRRTPFRQQDAPVPCHMMTVVKDPVEEVVAKPIKEPIVRHIRYPRGYPDEDWEDGCRILHKTAIKSEEGLCERCTRFRNGIEDIFRKSHELRRELAEKARAKKAGGSKVERYVDTGDELTIWREEGECHW